MGNVPSDRSVNELQRSLSGSVIRPTDAAYDSARRGFNALIDRRPALIARCVNADDVVTALGFAQAHELEVAVRGGGPGLILTRLRRPLVSSHQEVWLFPPV
jgi:FAD/FMN-containing dehydrogenase